MEPERDADPMPALDPERQRRRLRLLAELARARAVRTARLRWRSVAIRGLADVRRGTQD